MFLAELRREGVDLRRPKPSALSPRARDDLREARVIAALALARAAARSAHHATVHAAEALIFERTARAAKTQSGVLSEYARLAKDRPIADRDLAGLLTRACGHKEVAA